MDVISLKVQLSGYILVSVIALSVDFGSYLLLIGPGAVGAVLAGVIGYSIGLLVHFLLSNRFVFNNMKNKHIARLFTEFALTGILGVALTAATIKFAIAVFGASAIIAKVSAVVISFVVVYLLRRRVVFSDYA